MYRNRRNMCALPPQAACGKQSTPSRGHRAPGRLGSGVQRGAGEHPVEMCVGVELVQGSLPLRSRAAAHSPCPQPNGPLVRQERRTRHRENRLRIGDLAGVVGGNQASGSSSGKKHESAVTEPSPLPGRRPCKAPREHPRVDRARVRGQRQTSQTGRRFGTRLGRRIADALSLHRLLKWVDCRAPST